MLKTIGLNGLLWLLLCLLPVKVLSYDDYWVQELSVPKEMVQERTDSSAVTFSSDFSLYETFQTRNRLGWERTLPWGAFNQGVDYQFSQLNADSRIQFIDFSGNIFYNDFLTDGLRVGLEWTPIVSYRLGTMQSNVDFGPVLSHSVLTIPVKIKGGLYGHAWNDSIVQSLSKTPLDSYHGAPGIYGGCEIGDLFKPVAGKLPLYLSVKALGRALNGNKLGLFTGSVLFADELLLFGGGDSIFLHLGDSITNGKELYIGEYDGPTLYSNTSWRIDHSFSGTGGIKTRTFLGIEPRLYYRYYLHSIAYPENTRSLKDIRTTGQIFGVGIQSRKNDLFSYQGGIEFKWEFEDWLYKHHFRDDEIESSSRRDSLLINLSDHHSDIAETDHALIVYLPLGFSTKYTLRAFKDSKNYNFSFTDSKREKKQNQNENDRVQIDQSIGIRFDRDSLFYIEAYGNYGKLYHYYYKKERSAESKTTKEYRLGLNCGISWGPFQFSEHVYGDAEITDYYFKDYEEVQLKPPPYSRDVTSTLSGLWKIRKDRLHLVGKWVEMYHDDGAWYGKEYVADSIIAEKGEYYARHRKGTQYWIDLALETMFTSVKLSAGCMLRDVFQQRYNQLLQKYEVSKLDAGYGIEPYLRIYWMSDRLNSKFRIKRIFNTEDPDRFDLQKNWDMALSLQVVF